MTQPRTHYAARPSDDGLTIAFCNMLTPRATRDLNLVTCRLCKKKLEALPFTPDLPAWVPPPPGPAKIGRRNLSTADQRAIEDSKRGGKSRPLFRTMHDALRSWAQVQLDGYASGSVSGSYEALGTMGTLIQSAARGSSSTIRQADVKAEVDKVLAHAFGAWESTHADSLFSEADARSLFLAMEVGRPVIQKVRHRSGDREWIAENERAWHPVTATEIAGETGVSIGVIGSLRKWCRRRVRVELMARGLLGVPPRPVTAEDEENHGRRIAHWVRERHAVDVRRGELEVRG